MNKLKWCIKRTEENYKEVNEWIYKYNGSFDCICEYYVHSESFGDTQAFISHLKHPDFHEITLDEFRLLTDPESKVGYRHGESVHTRSIGCGITIDVSEPVFQELQRMWKEREVPQSYRDQFIAEGGKVLETDLELQEKLRNGKWEVEEIDLWNQWKNLYGANITAMNKVSKALTKQNKLLRKLIKKQNPKRHEKTIM